MPRLLELIAPLALGASLLAPAAAEEDEGDWIGPDEDLTWYDVEVLVFAHTGEPGAEAWPLEPGLPALAEALTLRPAPEDDEDPEELSESELLEPASPDMGQTPFRRLPPSAYRLKRTWKRLAESDAYRPLLHTAWRQPELPRKAAVPVHLHGGLFWYDQDAEDGVVIEPAVPATPPWKPEEGDAVAEIPVDDPSTVPEPSPVGPPAPVIDGTLRLVVSRYLHAEVDLLYRDPSPDPRTRTYRRPGLLVPPGAERQLPAGFRLQTSRRMRSGEIHYIDHPRFGILVLVNPRDDGEREEAKDSDTDPAAGDGAEPTDGGGIIRR
ncbi:MAG: CsiV family protein [Thiohalospira sp.]